jgi:membrane fusion protein, copper/silver efflux system
MTYTLRVATLCALLVVAFAAGAILNNRSTLAEPFSPARVLYWHDPMHPAYKSDRPGIAPDCGMRLEPVYAGEESTTSSRRDDVPAGTIHVSARKQQIIGVQVSPVERSAGAQHVRTVGRVAVDERRVFRINAAISGWIVEAYPNSVGSVVRKDEPLATFYARDFLGAQQAFLYALDARDRFRTQNAGDAQMASTNTQLQSAIDTLKALGMSATQIDELSHTRDRITNVEVRAPAAGFIVSRNVSPGQRFDIGSELYVIADLRHVWVLADLFQHEANFIRAGQTARISLPHRGRALNGRISEVLPQFDSATRTMKARLEVDNPDYVLRADMFVDVEFPLNLPPALTVPADAVIDAGLRKTVFVDLGDGYFEPRRVETGWRFGDRVQIVSGLMPSERVVTSGNFLLDSESRLRVGERAASADPVDPVCGMTVDIAKARKAGLQLRVQEKDYYFCSADCRDRFGRATP